MSTLLNRTTVTILTNKSGGNLNYGDVVILGTATAKAFTTTTTAAYKNSMIGVIIEPAGIANNAQGKIATCGWVPQINLESAAALYDAIATHTVAGQGSPHNAPIAAGDFAMALEASATPSAILFGATEQVGSGDIPAGTAEELTTAETDTGLVLAPDGAGGVAFVTPPSSSAFTQIVNESGTSFANWTGVSGTWSSDGTVIKQTDASANQRYARYTAKVMTSPLLFEAEVQLRSSGAVRLGGILGAFDGAGAAGGPGVRIDEGNDSSQIEVVGTGTRVNVTGLTINVNTWYKLRLFIDGNICTAWLDGTLLGSAGNMQNSNDARYIGLYTYQAEVWFRNIKAWNLSLPA